MANVYHNDLLAPFLALPQGDKVQAECKLFSNFSLVWSSDYRNHRNQMCGLMVMAVFVQRLRLVFTIEMS
jgi:hypothetical protein